MADLRVLATAGISLLRRGRVGRIVNVSSELGLTQVAADVGAPSITAYNLSRAALNMLTVF